MQLTTRQANYIRKKTKSHDPDPSEVAGELNIVPFLDIVTNLILFLLLTSAHVMIVAELDAHLPSLSRGRRASSTPQEGNALNLSVTVTAAGLIVSGSGGKLAPGCERTQTGAVITVPSRPPVSAAQDDQNLCGRDDSQDWPALTRCAARVHSQFPDETQVILTADPNIEYEQILCAMDALRAEGSDTLFPDVMLSAGVR